MLQRRVTYRFPVPHEMIVRYDERLPRRGEPVRSPSRELFVVSSVERDEVGGYLVRAVTPRVWLREARSHAVDSRRWSRKMRDRTEAVRKKTGALRALLDEKR